MEERGEELSLAAFISAPPQRRLRTVVVLLVTLAAGATDALSYLDLDRSSRVFSSFMTGNILFAGLALAQRNDPLLLRAVLAIVVFLTGVVAGALCLRRLPQQSPRACRRSLVASLSIEALVLLAFAVLWHATGDPADHPVAQVALLAIACFGMGLQGALVGALALPSVVSIALTGTAILLGERVAQRVTDATGGRGRGERRPGPGGPFLVALMLTYTLAAYLIVLARPWVGRPYIPVLLLALALIAVPISGSRR